jgi:2-C-methyl-D-erythritol 4-phosphate cytidylyltransferase
MDSMTSPSPRRTVAVVLAGGVGVRAGLGLPKQLVPIAGKTVLEHTIAALDASPDIDEIIVMMEPDHTAVVQDLIDGGDYPKLTQVHPGGATRNDTTRLALAQLDGDDTKVLLHDAVRPFVDARILRDCVRALDRFDAVDTAIPTADTIIKVRKHGTIKSIPRRAPLRRGQTPQAFRLATIRDAYALAVTDPDFTATDDCSVIATYLPDVPIFVVEGSAVNMKITEAIDVEIADKLFQLRNATATRRSDEERRQGFDGAVAVLFGGSEGIGQAIRERLEEFGARVLVFSRSETGTHVEDRASVRSAYESAHAAAGRIDLVINCAGMLHVGTVEDLTDELANQLLGVNVLGPLHVSQEGLPYLRESGGQLLFFTSSSYTRGRATYALYSATKAATVNFTQALAEEWAGYGIRVNCMSPQRTATAMRSRAFGEEPASSLLTPLEVADASLDVLLAGVTGQIVDVRRTPPPGTVAVAATPAATAARAG